jgi:antitoxin (DNA-binding transcriptional repressor) of toxin-antitoxin stability system
VPWHPVFFGGQWVHGDYRRIFEPVYNLVYTNIEESIMKIEVGSYEAKTKLPELLRGIQAGNRYTITLRGEAVAELVPAENNKQADAETAVAQMHAFMASALPVTELDLKALIEDGRA